MLVCACTHRPMHTHTQRPCTSTYICTHRRADKHTHRQGHTCGDIHTQLSHIWLCQMFVQKRGKNPIKTKFGGHGGLCGSPLSVLHSELNKSRSGVCQTVPLRRPYIGMAPAQHSHHKRKRDPGVPDFPQEADE